MLITSQAVLGAGDFVYFLNVPVTVAVRCLGGGNADETRQTRSRAGSRPMTGCRERAKPGELYRSGLLVALRALVIRLQPRAPNLQSHQPILASSSRASTSSLLLAVHSSALLLKKKEPCSQAGPGVLARRRWIGRTHGCLSHDRRNDSSFTCSMGPLCRIAEPYPAAMAILPTCYRPLSDRAGPSGCPMSLLYEP